MKANSPASPAGPVLVPVGSWAGVPCWGALPEQLTAVGVHLVIDGFLEDAAEVQGQPAEREDHHQAEHGLGHLPALPHRPRASEHQEQPPARGIVQWLGLEGDLEGQEHLPPAQAAPETCIRCRLQGGAGQQQLQVGHTWGALLG